MTGVQIEFLITFVLIYRVTYIFYNYMKYPFQTIYIFVNELTGDSDVGIMWGKFSKI